jgi:hypothetical protein
LGRQVVRLVYTVGLCRIFRRHLAPVSLSAAGELLLPASLAGQFTLAV